MPPIFVNGVEVEEVFIDGVETEVVFVNNTEVFAAGGGEDFVVTQGTRTFFGSNYFGYDFYFIVGSSINPQSLSNGKDVIDAYYLATGGVQSDVGFATSGDNETGPAPWTEFTLEGDATVYTPAMAYDVNYFDADDYTRWLFVQLVRPAVWDGSGNVGVNIVV